MDNSDQKPRFRLRADGRLVPLQSTSPTSTTPMTAEKWERCRNETCARMIRQLAIKQRFEFGDKR